MQKELAPSHFNPQASDFPLNLVYGTRQYDSYYGTNTSGTSTEE